MVQPFLWMVFPLTISMDDHAASYCLYDTKGGGPVGAVGATLGGLIHDVTEGYAAVIALALGAISIPVVIFWTVPELRAAGRWRR